MAGAIQDLIQKVAMQKAYKVEQWLASLGMTIDNAKEYYVEVHMTGIGERYIVRHLGSVIGENEFVVEYATGKDGSLYVNCISKG